MKFLRNKLFNVDLKTRIGYTAILFIILFFGATVIAYYFLPEGLLKNKNPLQNWQTSSNVILSTIQIFLFNSISFLVIFIGSLFAQKKESNSIYCSFGYAAFFTLVLMNGIVLGTWSFSVESASMALLPRLLRSLDLAHRAGLWEMAGQLLFTCSLAQSAIVLTNGKNTTAKKISTIRLKKPERIAMIASVFLLFIGALVESTAIINAS